MYVLGLKLQFADNLSASERKITSKIKNVFRFFFSVGNESTCTCTPCKHIYFSANCIDTFSSLLLFSPFSENLTNFGLTLMLINDRSEEPNRPTSIWVCFNDHKTVFRYSRQLVLELFRCTRAEQVRSVDKEYCWLYGWWKLVRQLSLFNLLDT